MIGHVKEMKQCTNLLCLHQRIFESQYHIYIYTVGDVDWFCLAADGNVWKAPLNLLISVIILVVLQNSMDLLKGELGSSSKTCVTSTVIKEEEDQEPTTIPVIKTEPAVSCVPVLSVRYISYRLYAELPACMI